MEGQAAIFGWAVVQVKWTFINREKRMKTETFLVLVSEGSVPYELWLVRTLHRKLPATATTPKPRFISSQPHTLCLGVWEIHGFCLVACVLSQRQFHDSGTRLKAQTHIPLSTHLWSRATILWMERLESAPLELFRYGCLLRRFGVGTWARIGLVGKRL